jgi:hypothetical protein
MPTRAMAANRRAVAGRVWGTAGPGMNPDKAAVKECCAWPLLAFNFGYLARVKFCQKLPGLFRVKLGIR